MSNIRLLYDNSANRAIVTTSATATSLGAANLLTDVKSAVCRSTSKTLTIALTWPSTEIIDCAALAFTDLSTTATMNVKGYLNTGDTAPIYNQTKLCAQGSLVDDKGVNNFAYGGGVYATHFLPTKITVRKLEIVISDEANTLPYVEVGRLIVGSCWEPDFGVEQENTSITVVDTSTQFRTDSGNQHITIKPRHRKQNLSMPSLDRTDQTHMWRILWNNGIVKPLFLSLFPDNDDKVLEQAHTLYGRLVTTPVMQTPYFSYQNATLDVEEI